MIVLYWSVEYFVHIFDCLINNFVKTKIYAFLICKLFCHRIRTNVKSDDDRIGSCCQRYVGFIDCAYTAVDHTNNNLFIRKFDQTLFHGFYRTLYICFDDDRQFFQITCLNLIKEIIKGKFAFCFFKEVFLILVCQIIKSAYSSSVISGLRSLAIK